MLTKKILFSISKYRLLAKNDTVLTAVSGGPDSVCLLLLLYSLRKKFRLKLACCHLNHMLRGKDSQTDMLFVKKLCEKMKIPFYAQEINIRAIAINGSLEEIARKVRHNFFLKIADEIKADKIALAHTLDDQAETVLMRLIRGTGLYGLSAILPKREFSKHILIRPLIDITKKEIFCYLKKKKTAWRIDKTNKEDVFFRNRLRNRLMPELKKYNANIAAVLANLAQSTSLDYDYIKTAAQKSLDKVKTQKNSLSISLNKDKFLKTHSALRRMILRLAIEQLCGNLRRFTYAHIQELEDLIENRKDGSIVDLPQHISAQNSTNLIKIYCRKKENILLK